MVSAHDENRIRAWLAHISETDPVTIREVLAKCRTEPEALAYYLRRADEEVPTKPSYAEPETGRHLELPFADLEPLPKYQPERRNDNE